MKLTEEHRRSLRRANLIVKGLLLSARCTDDREARNEILRDAALHYGLWLAEAKGHY
jgi:hypothetical protein